jgi:hypothetical protein
MDDTMIQEMVEYQLRERDFDKAIEILSLAYGTDWGEAAFPRYMQYGRMFRKYGGKDSVRMLAAHIKAGSLSQYKVVKFSGWLDSKLMKF